MQTEGWHWHADGRAAFRGARMNSVFCATVEHTLVLQKSASMSVLTVESLAMDGGGAAILWGFYSGDVCRVWGFGLTAGLHEKMLI